MAFGTVNAQISIQDAVGNQPAATGYVVALDWEPIVEGVLPYAYTTSVSVADAGAGPVTVSRPNAPLSNGSMYIRVYAVAGTVIGPLV
jgi:hypothetical protein